MNTPGILTRSKIKRANSRRKCPVCGGQGCGVSDSMTLCWRVESRQQAKSGAWIHRDPSASAVPYIYTPPRVADLERRHQVYSALLESLPLSSKHADHLMGKRGLSEETIARECFASVPSRPDGDEIAGRLGLLFDLEHVAGFWKKRDRWVMRFAGTRGFLIPLRDSIGRIQALQIRRDTDDDPKYLLFSSDELPAGATSGAPAHFCKPYRAGREVVITEGALKANTAAEYLDACVVGLVAVGTFSDGFGAQLIRDLGQVGRATIAYDADWRTNDKVRLQMKRLIASLRAAQIEPRIATWDDEDGKGIDDYLQSKGGEEWL